MIVDLSKEKGSSSWVSVFPLEEHGVQGEFMDALCPRYGWKPNNTPQTHVMICHMGFPTIRHNESRDITATEVCNNVATEPPLQPLSGESVCMTAYSANTDDGARVDIRARGFWNVSQDEFFFYVRVFYPNASSNCLINPSPVYRRHELANKQEYGQQIREVEHGVFTLLVLSTTGGKG